MADFVKSETDQERADRRAYLHGTPAYKPANEAMTANVINIKREPETEGDSILAEEPSGERHRPGNIPRIQRLKLNGPKQPLRRSQRLKLIGTKQPMRPKRLKLTVPKPPIRRINTILTIQGTDKREYKRGGNTYICPKGIKPWTAEHRWMLDPKEGIFK